jgi:Polyketide cyclase / dehydrase and lipid transport
MAAVAATLALPASVHDAETVWYDVTGWPAWIDGLDSVVAVQGAWPAVGASVTWQSVPAGRGRVTERVVGYERLVGQTLEVEDDSIRGRQSVTFTPLDDGVEVELRLEYKLKKRSLLMPIVDVLFVRNAWRSSLRSTLTRFGVELAGRASGAKA